MAFSCALGFAAENGGPSFPLALRAEWLFGAEWRLSCALCYLILLLLESPRWLVKGGGNGEVLEVL